MKKQWTVTAIISTMYQIVYHKTKPSYLLIVRCYCMQSRNMTKTVIVSHSPTEMRESGRRGK